MQKLIRAAPMEQILQEARVAHNITTGHTEIIVGLNFVECLECGRHAHSPKDGALILHNSDFSICKNIPATEF